MLHDEPSLLQINKTRNNSTFDDSYHHKNSPKLGNIKTQDYNNAKEMIDEGKGRILIIY